MGKFLRSGSAFLTKAVALLALFGFAAVLTAKADSTTTSVTGEIPISGSLCTNGLSGTLAANGSGGVYFTTGGSSPDCYAGGTSIPSYASGSFPASVFSLTSGAYAESGEICYAPTSGSEQCVASAFEALVNTTASSMGFNVGTINNVPPSPTTCSANTSTETLTVAANTICFEDLTDSGSIAFTVNAPTPVTPTPEPSSLFMLGSGLLSLAGAGIFRKRIV